MKKITFSSVAVPAVAMQLQESQLMRGTFTKVGVSVVIGFKLAAPGASLNSSLKCLALLKRQIVGETLSLHRS